MERIVPPREADRISAAGQLPAAAESGTGRAAAVIAVFMISLCLPVFFSIGTFSLSPYRLVLIALAIPCLIMWVGKWAGRILLPDVLILLHIGWVIFALLVIEGISTSLESGGVFFLESFISYLIARTFIRNERDFRVFARVWVILVAILVPFAIFEAFTNIPLILRFFSNVAVGLRVYVEGDHGGLRLGLHRAQVVFPHPILFGAFCGGAFGLSFYVFGKSRMPPWRLTVATPAVVGTIASLSSGAWTSVAVQLILTAWDHGTRAIRNRWRLLGILFAAAYVAVDLISNRTPFHVMVTYLSFNQGSAYNRIFIWQFGTAEVARHPIFGVGLSGDWARPSWMSSSMDNFWLVIALRYGIPAFLLIAGAVIVICWRLGRLKLPDSIADCRKGLLITIAGLTIGGATVHYWHAVYCLYMFVLGSGIWMFYGAHDDRAEQANGDIPEQSAGNKSGPILDESVRATPILR